MASLEAMASLELFLEAVTEEALAIRDLVALDNLEVFLGRSPEEVMGVGSVDLLVAMKGA